MADEKRLECNHQPLEGGRGGAFEPIRIRFWSLLLVRATHRGKEKSHLPGEQVANELCGELSRGRTLT